METKYGSKTGKKIFFLSGMIYKELFVFIFIVLSFASHSQIVGTSAYVKGTNVELGINGNGGYEGVDISSFPMIQGMHFRSNTEYFGFTANPQLNNWNTFDGDFFTPGCPENGWGITLGDGVTSFSNNCNHFNEEEIQGSITNWSHVFDCYSVSWEGNITSATNLHVKINYLLEESALYYTTTVSITNRTNAEIPELYYYRNLDPDNNVTINGNYGTNNTVVSQPGTNNCIIAHVSATQDYPWDSYVGFAAAGINWKASYGGFLNSNGYELWNNIMGQFTQVTGISEYGDIAISLSYKIENLKPGATETFKFVVILDKFSSSNAIKNLMYLSYPGSVYTAPANCTSNFDTVLTCGSSVPIDVQGSAVDDYNWSWNPALGLSTVTGSNVIANPPGTTTYTVTGVPLVSCLDTVMLSIVVKVTNDSGIVLNIVPLDTICLNNVPLNLTANLSGGVWSGNGITDTYSGTFNPAIAGIGNHTIMYLMPSTCNIPDTIVITVVDGGSQSIIEPPLICTSSSPFDFISLVPGGVWSGTGITNAFDGTFDPSVSGSGNFMISYNHPGGCIYSGSINIVVNQTPVSNAGPDISVCQTGTTLQGITDIGFGTWTQISGPGIISFSNSNLAITPIVASLPGSYILQWSVINNGCSNIDSVIIELNQAPYAYAGQDDVTCNKAYILSADSSYPGWWTSNYSNIEYSTNIYDPSQYIFNNLNLSADSTVSLIWNVFDGICYGYDTLSLTFLKPPHAEFDTTVFQQYEAVPYEVQFINYTEHHTKYSWRIYNEEGILIETSGLPEPIYTFTEAGCYKIVLVALNSRGCIDTMNFNPFCVGPSPELLIPNVFTPNNDGQNDVFRVHGESIIEFKAKIFNRWGKKIYEWDDVNGYWDGKAGGSEAAPGEYYYIIKAKGKKEMEYEEKGFFYLLREK